MQLHRRRVYHGNSYSRRMRLEGNLSLTVYLAAAVFLLSVLGSLPDLASQVVGWFVPAQPYPFGTSSADSAPLWAELRETLMAVSGACLGLALFLKFLGRRGTH